MKKKIQILKLQGIIKTLLFEMSASKAKQLCFSVDSDSSSFLNFIEKREL